MVKMSVEIDIDFEVWCSCGAGLCNVTSASGTSVTVHACSECVDTAREEGIAEGFKDGYSRGQEEMEN